MTNKTRMVLAPVVVLLGVALMIGGIITDKNGAVVVGLISAAVSTQQWIAIRRQGGGGSGPSRSS